MSAISDLYNKLHQGGETQEAGEGIVNFGHVASDIGNWFKHLNYNPLSTWQNVSFATPPTPPPYKVVNPVNAAGEHPTNYTPTNEDQIKKLLGTGQSVPGFSDKELESGLTDAEYETLQKESASGNSLAMSLLDEYKSQYLLKSPVQQAQALVQPIVSDIQGLGSDFTSEEAQQKSLTDTLPQNIEQMQSTAAQYSGISPQAPNAQTTALDAQYGALAQQGINAATPIMSAAYKDLGNAAALSLKTFPYSTLIDDLLNRYAYQLESPSYPAPPVNLGAIPDAIKKLFSASTGSAISGLGIAAPSTLGTADQSGITAPALTPAVNPSSSG